MIEEFKQTLEKHLKPNLKVLVYDTVDSTNTVAKDLAKETENTQTLVVSLSQTAGRGRKGRTFFSKGGVYISILLFPKKTLKTALLMTVAAAVAVCRSLEKHCEKECKIKWVNDVFVDDKKVCGILTEAASDGKNLDYAVVGIGINLERPCEDFPKEISDIADAVFDGEITTDKKAAVTADVVNEFFSIYENLEDTKFLDEYRSRSWLDGKTVTYLQGSKTHTALVAGINGEGGLEVLDNGQRTVLKSGEVSVKVL